MTDLSLIQRALERDPWATDRLAERLRCVRPILAAMNSRLPRPLDEDELADMVQNVLLALWSKLDRYRGTTPLESWIYGFCRFEVMNGMQRRRRVLSREALIDVASEEPSEPVKLPSEFDGLRAGLEQMTANQSIVIRMKHFEGLTFEEIGIRLSISANTAKTRYYRGLIDLESILSRTGSRRGEP